MHRLMLRWPCPNTSCPPTSKTPATPNLICGPVQICWHKFGLAPLGVGWVIWRDAQCLPEELVFDVNYLGGNMPTFALNFSRPGGQIIAQDKVNFSLYDFADRLRVRGWQVPAYSMPADREDLVVQRILVRHGFSRDLANLLLDDFQRSLQYFEEHPTS